MSPPDRGWEWIPATPPDDLHETRVRETQIMHRGRFIQERRSQRVRMVMLPPFLEPDGGAGSQWTDYHRATDGAQHQEKTRLKLTHGFYPRYLPVRLQIDFWKRMAAAEPDSQKQRIDSSPAPTAKREHSTALLVGRSPGINGGDQAEPAGLDCEEEPGQRDDKERQNESRMIRYAHGATP